jgi:hypothetical protein
MGSTDVGSKAWVSTTGTWGISSNKAYISAVAGINTVALVDVGFGEYTTLSADIVFPSGGNGGIVFRATDGADYLCARIASNSLVLLKREAGLSSTLVSATPTLSFGNTYTLKITMIGTLIQVFIDGVVTIRYSMSASDIVSFPSTKTKVGLREGAGTLGGTWDNFLAKNPEATTSRSAAGTRTSV